MDLLITDTIENFETWYNKKFVSSELKESITNADILIVPFENLRETTNPLLFPIGTEEILRYFKDKLPEDNLIDICISDEDYQEFAFYSDYKRLGNFVITTAVVPFFVTVLSAYVYDKYIKQDNSKPQIVIVDKSTHTNVMSHVSKLTKKKYLEPTHIKFSVTIADSNGTSKNIKYEGPADQIDKALSALKKYEN